MREAYQVVKLEASLPTKPESSLPSAEASAATQASELKVVAYVLVLGVFAKRLLARSGQ